MVEMVRGYDAGVGDAKAGASLSPEIAVPLSNQLKQLLAALEASSKLVDNAMARTTGPAPTTNGTSNAARTAFATTGGAHGQSALKVERPESNMASRTQPPSSATASGLVHH